MQCPLLPVFAVVIVLGATVLAACDENAVDDLALHPVVPAIRLETGAELTDGIAKATAYAVAHIVRHEGWPCDSVTALRCTKRVYGPDIHTVAWGLRCNAGADVYRVIEQRRGDSIVFEVDVRSTLTVRLSRRGARPPSETAGTCPPAVGATPERRLGVTEEELRQHHGKAIAHWTDDELLDAAYRHYADLYDREEFERLFLRREGGEDLGD